MNSFRENVLIGLLIALTIGPDLPANPGLSLAIRLSSAALLLFRFGRRAAADLTAQLLHSLFGPRIAGSSKAELP